VDFTAGEAGKVHEGQLDSPFEGVGEFPKLLGVGQSPLPLGLRGAAQAAEVGHGGVEPVSRTPEQEESGRDAEYLGKTGDEVWARPRYAGLILAHGCWGHPKSMSDVLLRHLC
jgi:hypothetical protein